ncbi:MAG: TlpA disulfide reductase family protein [Pseudomonadota bacterium]
MKKLVLIVFALIWIAGCSQGKQIEFADGTSTQSTHWDGRWLVINYWAEWCGPCRHEIPELNQLHEERVSHGLVVLGVNYDRLQGQALTDVIQRMQIEFPTLVVDPDQEYGYDRAQVLPMTVIIDPQRQVHEILSGPQTAQSILAVTSIQ